MPGVLSGGRGSALHLELVRRLLSLAHFFGVERGSVLSPIEALPLTRTATSRSSITSSDALTALAGLVQSGDTLAGSLMRLG